MNPISTGFLAVANEVILTEVVAGNQHEAGKDFWLLRNLAWPAALARLWVPKPSTRITHRVLLALRPKALVSPLTACKALINTSPSLPNDLGGAGNIVGIQTSLPQLTFSH